MENTNKEFYTLKEIEDLLSISQRSLYRWIKDGKLKAVKVGYLWRVSKKDLQEFLDNKH